MKKKGRSNRPSSSSSSRDTLLLVGDSDIERWPKHLLPCFDGYRVVVSGHSGATLEQILPFARQQLASAADDSDDGRIVVVCCAGENDMGEGTSIDDSKAALHELLDIISEYPRVTKCVFLGPKLEPWLQDDFESRKHYIRLSQAFEKCCTGHTISSKVRYVDCLVMFCGESGKQAGALLGGKANAEKDYFDDDQLHLSDKGYALWKDVVEEAASFQPLTTIMVAFGDSSGEEGARHTTDPERPFDRDDRETTDTEKLSYKELRKVNNPDRKRHGARNQHKTKHFVRWLTQTFPRAFQSDAPIIDIAGGKGELAARLCVCHQRRVVLVDPRPCDPVHCFETLVYPKIPNKWQDRIVERKNENPDFVKDLFQERFKQHVTYFDETVLTDTNGELAQAIQTSSLLVGMHADGATEAIVDAGLLYDKPFVVVPCCVFPNLFQQRTIVENGEQVSVRSHEQFCTYLLNKDPRLKKTILPFEGRNVAIWWVGGD